MYKWATDLFPICRSITGPGVRHTLAYLTELIPELIVHEVKSGTTAFNWTVPDEWTIRDAYIADDFGVRIIDFKKNNLHVLGYSEPVDLWLDREDLLKYLYSLPEQPDAIPYITSYYERRWGFCLTDNQLKSILPGRYHVFIDSDLKPGVLNYGEIILKGKEDSEILLSTYVCHPSMGNNEISGIVVTCALTQWLRNLENRRFTYRILFLPETIGSIVYLSLHSQWMKEKTIAGFVITCVGDDNSYSFMPSRRGKSIADRVAKYALDNYVDKYISYSFLDRGSDERQYNSPLIDLPVVSIMRSKYGTYPEYHTSLDDMSYISQVGLDGSFRIIKKCLSIFEINEKYLVTIECEPQLGKIGLYPSLSTKNSGFEVKAMMDLLAYADGELDLLGIATIIGVDVIECSRIANMLEQYGLLKTLKDN